MSDKTFAYLKEEGLTYPISLYSTTFEPPTKSLIFIFSMFFINKGVCSLIIFKYSEPIFEIHALKYAYKYYFV